MLIHCAAFGRECCQNSLLWYLVIHKHNLSWIFLQSRRTALAQAQDMPNKHRWKVSTEHTSWTLGMFEAAWLYPNWFREASQALHMSGHIMFYYWKFMSRAIQWHDRTSNHFLCISGKWKLWNPRAHSVKLDVLTRIGLHPASIWILK